ncbi:MAG: TRAP transporter TatT component family protein [Lysobacterales bacterium]
MTRYVLPCLCLAALLASVGASADSGADLVASVQKHWAEANYASKGKAREQAFESLTAEADSLVRAEPKRAEAHIWAGIVYSTYAGEVSIFSAGKQVKRARSELEQALAIDPDAMNGSAYTSLGALLYQIPGVMGGDDDKAEQLLRKGVELNRDGIDSNYFYATFLIDQKRYDEALDYLQKAAAAPDRPSRPLADRGRRAEIAAALEDLRKRTS